MALAAVFRKGIGRAGRIIFKGLQRLPAHAHINHVAIAYTDFPPLGNGGSTQCHEPQPNVILSPPLRHKISVSTAKTAKLEKLALLRKVIHEYVSICIHSWLKNK